MMRRRRTGITTWLTVAVLGWWFAGPPGALVAVGVRRSWSGVVDAAASRVERRARAGRLATTMEVAARAVRTGASVDVALDEAAALTGGRAGELVAELVWLGRAETLAAAAHRWAQRHDDPSVALIAAVVTLTAGPLGGSAGAFEAAASILRERDAAAREAAAWAAQSTASASLLVAAPIVLAALGGLVDPSSVARILAEPLALASVLLGLVLDAAGAWWMARMVRGVAGPR